MYSLSSAIYMKLSYDANSLPTCYSLSGYNFMLYFLVRDHDALFFQVFHEGFCELAPFAKSQSPLYQQIAKQYIQGSVNENFKGLERPLYEGHAAV